MHRGDIAFALSDAFSGCNHFRFTLRSSEWSRGWERRGSKSAKLLQQNQSVVLLDVFLKPVRGFVDFTHRSQGPFIIAFALRQGFGSGSRIILQPKTSGNFLSLIHIIRIRGMERR